VQAQTSTTDSAQRAALNEEYIALGRQWGRIVADTKWNGTAVMQGTDLNVGVGSGSTITVEIDDWQTDANVASDGGSADAYATGAATAAAAGVTGAGFDFAQTAAGPPEVTDESITTSDTAKKAMDKVTAALIGIGKSRAELGASINALKASADSLVDLADRYESNASAIGDSDYASESARLATAQIVSQTATAMLAQANAQKGTVLSLLQ